MRTPDGNIVTPVSTEEEPELFPDTTDKDEAVARYEASKTRVTHQLDSLRESWSA